MDEKHMIWLIIAFIIGFFSKHIIQNLVCKNLCPLVEGNVLDFVINGEPDMTCESLKNIRDMEERVLTGTKQKGLTCDQPTNNNAQPTNNNTP